MTFQSLCCPGLDWLFCVGGIGAGKAKAIYCWSLNNCKLQTWFVAENAKFSLKIYFIAARSCWQKKTDGEAWLTGRKELQWLVPFTSSLARVTSAFYCYRPKISVTAV